MARKDMSFEVCPVCGKEGRNPSHPMCRGCNNDFNEKIEKAERDGDIVLVTRLEFAKTKGVETLVRLQGESAAAEKDKERFYREAQEQIRLEMKSGGAFTVNRQEFNRQVGKRFGELLGNPNRANEIWDILNNHPRRIESLENFLNQEEVESSDIEGEEAVA
jgi:hypothetical protein